MNLTLSVNDELVKDARQAAEAMGKSLNQLIREYLEQLTARDHPSDDVEELRRLTTQGEGRSQGWRFDRGELHERS